ncbi:MAG: hypothetical protein B6D71_09300 [gamma proteobacterium symbiont of Stewartia floridana]|nr:MAG: hypothetical protein B6D71_09300 [gamma proteobacterium symbiont of Stewartia floridana]
MKIGQLIIKGTIIVVITLVLVKGFVIYMDSEFDDDCAILNRISKDPVLSDAVFRKISFYYREPKLLSNIGRSTGVVYIEEMDKEIDINWDQLGIPKRHATIEVKGKGVNYSYIDPENVEEIRIGFGYRSHLVYVVNTDKKVGNLQYDLYVECNDK